jgi:hypothetical protein
MVLVEAERLFVRQWVPDDWIRFRPLGTASRDLFWCRLNRRPAQAKTYAVARMGGGRQTLKSART